MTKKNAWNLAEATIKGGIALLPGGSFLIEYYNLATDKIASKRFETWKELLETRLAEMQTDIDKLSSNEFFFSCFQLATASALKTHQKEKLEMFSAALFNSLEFPNLSEDKKLFFVTLLDKYTVNTVRLLAFFSRKKKYERTVSSGMITTTLIGGTEPPLNHIHAYFPEFEQDSSYVQSIGNQLSADGMIHQIKWNMPDSPEDIRNKKTTAMGDEFLAFIEASKLE